MFVDARSVESGTRIQSDLCVIGGGAAGITLAKGLAGTGISITMLEAGGTEFDQETQDVY